MWLLDPASLKYLLQSLILFIIHCESVAMISLYAWEQSHIHVTRRLTTRQEERSEIPQ